MSYTNKYLQHLRIIWKTTNTKKKKIIRMFDFRQNLRIYLVSCVFLRRYLWFKHYKICSKDVEFFPVPKFLTFLSSLFVKPCIHVKQALFSSIVLVRASERGLKKMVRGFKYLKTNSRYIYFTKVERRKHLSVLVSSTLKVWKVVATKSIIGILQAKDFSENQVF